MPTANPATCRPVSPESIAHLGDKISDRPSIKHRTIAPLVVCVLSGLLAIGIIYLIVAEGWTAWLWCAIPVLGIVMALCFSKSPIQGLSIYENGIVVFDDMTEEIGIHTWDQLELGITPWSEKAEYYIKDRGREKTYPLESPSLLGTEEEITAELVETSRNYICRYWNQILEQEPAVDYTHIQLTSEGLFFKKKNTLIPWGELDHWTVNEEDWCVVYVTSTGRVIETGLFTYHVPYVDAIFHFASQRVGDAAYK